MMSETMNYTDHETKLLNAIRCQAIRTHDDVPMFLLGALQALTKRGLIRVHDGTLYIQ